MHSSFFEQPSTVPDDRATDFKPVEGENGGEHFSGFTLMVEAYSVIWFILLVWLVTLWRKQANLTTRIGGLEDAITRAESRGLAQRTDNNKDISEKAASETEASA